MVGVKALSAAGSRGGPVDVVDTVHHIIGAGFVWVYQYQCSRLPYSYNIPIRMIIHPFHFRFHPSRGNRGEISLTLSSDLWETSIIHGSFMGHSWVIRASFIDHSLIIHLIIH